MYCESSWDNNQGIKSILRKVSDNILTLPGDILGMLGFRKNDPILGWQIFERLDGYLPDFPYWEYLGEDECQRAERVLKRIKDGLEAPDLDL